MGWLLYLAAMPAVLVILMRALALVLPKGPAQLLNFYAFAITSFTLLTLCAGYGVFASILFRAIGYGGCSQWTVGRAFKWTMWATTGITFRVSGSMKQVGGVSGEDALTMRPAVFVGNHQTSVCHSGLVAG